MKIAALTSGINVASTRFRIRQYIEPLKNKGIFVDEFIPRVSSDAQMPYPFNKFRVRYVFPVFLALELMKIISRIPGLYRSSKYDAIWLSRGIMSGLTTFEYFLKRPYIYDLDDAVWTAKPFGANAVAKLARNAAVVFAGNEYLANWVGRYNSKVEIIPTAIDLQKFYSSNYDNKDQFIIGWTGMALNYNYLYQIENVLAQFLNNCSDAFLHVIAERPPKFTKINNQKLIYTKWQPEIESSAMDQWSIGIMPLLNDEFSRGKCSFKMLQYMSKGLPVIVSPIGLNADILNKGNIGISAITDADWATALEHYYSNRKEAVYCGLQGRSIVERHYSLRVISDSIEIAIKRHLG